MFNIFINGFCVGFCIFLTVFILFWCVAGNSVFCIDSFRYSVGIPIISGIVNVLTCISENKSR
jgi:hypothetical protein